MSGDSIQLLGKKRQLANIRTVSARESGDHLVWLIIRRVGAISFSIAEWGISSVERVCDGSLVDN